MMKLFRLFTAATIFITAGPAWAALAPADLAILNGQNLLKNPGFESGRQGWNSPTAALAVETTNISSGKQSMKVTYAANAGTLGQTITPTVQIANLNMEATCHVKTTLSGISVYADVNGTVAGSQAVPATGNWTTVTQNFIGPLSGSVSIEVGTTVSTTGTVYVDDCYVGAARNLGSGAYASDETDRSADFTVNGFGTVSEKEVFVSRVGDKARIRGHFISGTPSATIASLQLPSDLVVQISKTAVGTGAASLFGYGFVGNAASGGMGSNNNIEALFSDGTTTNLIFITPTGASGSLAKSAGNTILGSGQRVFFDFTTPISGWTSNGAAFRPEQTPASWSGFHDGDCNFGNTTTVPSLSDYNADSTCTFTERQNRNFGTVSSYLSAGNKLPGIVFTAPRAGRYYVCANMSVYDNTTNGFQIMELSDTAGTPNIIATAQLQSDTAAQQKAVSLCGIYNAAASALTTIRVRGGATAATQTNIGGSTGAHAIEWSIIELDAPMAGPVIIAGPRSEVWVNQFNSRGSTNTSVVYFSSVQLNTGTDITYTPSSVNGDSFTINSSGVYSMSLSEQFATLLCLSRNSTTLAASLPSVPQNIKSINFPANGGDMGVTMNLTAGDVIRVQATALSGANVNQFFRIAKVSN